MQAATLQEPEVLDVATRRQLAVAKIAEITRESAAKRAALLADKAKAEADFQRKQKSLSEAGAKLGGIERQLLSLGFSTDGLVNRERLHLRETAPPCCGETLVEISRMESKACSSFASRETYVRDDAGNAKRTFDGRHPIETVSNGAKINAFLGRAKIAKQEIESLIYAPLGPLEIEAEVDRILEEMGPISQPRPMVVDDQFGPVL